ncbi:MAG: hypothetical protein FJZ92_08330 [Chloroflexi bacterium]|nr:hypothetical protein [Chloroflexota bacterium]
MARQTIEVDEAVFEAIRAKAVPFEDHEPNDVLRRLLLGGERDSGGAAKPRVGLARRKRRPRDSARGGGARAPKGVLVPEDAYYVPILKAIETSGGEARSGEVVSYVGERLRERMSDYDRGTTATGNVRWKNRVQFARLRLVQQGYLEGSSEKGIWRISTRGRKWLAEQTPAKSVS